MYNQSDKGQKYISKAKSICFNLNRNSELKENLIIGSITGKQLAEMDVKVVLLSKKGNGEF